VTSIESRSGIDVFPLLRLKDVICGYADLEAPWEALQQRTGRHWLYVVQRGTCRVELIQESRMPISLGEGDVLAVANDASHSLRHAQARGAHAAAHPLRVHSPGERGSFAERATTVLLVASVSCASEPLSELFPTIFHVPADGSSNSRRIADLVRLIEDEIAGSVGQPGGSAVVDRLGDLILIELLRVETKRVNEANPVWVHGIADPLVARLVTHFHGEPGGHWNWTSMCRAASLSRSALDRRFRSVLGQSPKRYLFALRMRLAAAALAEGRKSIAEIASSVGYESEPAFHRAFHRKLGLTPGVYGRSKRTRVT
jgi:AraC-like DNA-binding protein